MDRFAMRLSLGYVSTEQETAIVEAEVNGPAIDEVENCISQSDVVNFTAAAKQVFIPDELKRYAVELVGATREQSELSLGASPRASITLIKCAQALAIFDNQNFVNPDHLQELAPVVIAHRLALDSNARFGGVTADTIVSRLLSELPVPR